MLPCGRAEQGRRAVRASPGADLAAHVSVPQTLGLLACQLTAKGVGYIMDALKTNSTLLSLQLDANDMDSLTHPRIQEVCQCQGHCRPPQVPEDLCP